MHRAVFETFDEICHSRGIRGSVLEIGATPDDLTLLNMPSLASAAEKIGINKFAPFNRAGLIIHPIDANDMACFADQRFDVVLCNAVLEHDRFFWKTLAEIRRVVRIGGLVVIGAPGYGKGGHDGVRRLLLRTLQRFARYDDDWPILHSTNTLNLHNFPSDYYRFSEQAFRQVFSNQWVKSRCGPS